MVSTNNNMFKIYTKQNRSMPAGEFSVSAENIKLNVFMLPAEIDSTYCYSPNNTRLWAICNSFGAIGCVFAGNEQVALNNAVDLGMMEHCRDKDQDWEDEELTSLGKAGELFDLSGTWMAEVDFNAERDIKLIFALVRASENAEDDLSDYA